MTTKKKFTGPKVLVYDIETMPLLPTVFRIGKVGYIGPEALLMGYFSHSRIICITYRWAHETKTKAFHWGESIEDEADMIAKFDIIASEADIIIGKNNVQFDNKHINFNRLMLDLPVDSSWADVSDDLQQQMFKYFNMPNYGLDYLLKKIFGKDNGKIKMDLGDWQKILAYRIYQLVNTVPNNKHLEGVLSTIQLLTGFTPRQIVVDGKAALNKMIKYGKKDTEDTLKAWNYCKNHFKPKFNYQAFLNKRHDKELCCRNCGIENIVKNGTRIINNVKYQTFYCIQGHYAGKARIMKDGTFGVML